jgi:putative CocE/NonD family hydrolase
MLVAGHPRCVLHVTSSAPQTDFVVRLSRVLANGQAIFICLGAARAFAREGVEVDIALDPTALRFAAGERIRIDIASSAFPLLVRNPNTGADPASVAKPGEFKRALQIVHHNEARPSRLVLPVLPV